MIKKTNEFSYDAIIFVASDAVDKRMGAYNRIASYFAQNFSYIDTNIQLPGGRRASILFNKTFDKNDYDQFKQYIGNINK